MRVSVVAAGTQRQLSRGACIDTQAEIIRGNAKDLIAISEFNRRRVKFRGETVIDRLRRLIDCLAAEIDPPYRHTRQDADGKNDFEQHQTTEQNNCQCAQRKSKYEQPRHARAGFNFRQTGGSRNVHVAMIPRAGRSLMALSAPLNYTANSKRSRPRPGCFEYFTDSLASHLGSSTVRAVWPTLLPSRAHRC